MPPRPNVAIACLADNVLHEKDGVISLIRIVDKFIVAVPPGLPEGAKPHVSTNLVLALRCPDFQGSMNLSIQVHGPTQAGPQQPVAVQFPGGYDSGANLVTQVVLGITNFGRCRIDINCGDELLTSIPFTLEQREEQPGSSDSPLTKQM